MNVRYDLFHQGGKLIISHGYVLTLVVAMILLIAGTAEGKTRWLREGHKIRAKVMDLSAHFLIPGRRDVQSSCSVMMLTACSPTIFGLEDTDTSYWAHTKSRTLGVSALALSWLILLTQSIAQRQKCGVSRSDVIRWMFTFQWCEGQGEPWWWDTIPRDDSELTHSLHLFMARIRSNSVSSSSKRNIM
jgi:hypothetical protein